ncbi:ComEA family DNA-binding protein [Mangrovitalea sediminis]|uniref:ComEA family DNA-binding protein n=1 Tax=Mangrovitalea sediminis TaxID=1982043 RepID=UPI000BE502C1|nr:helix-hairpin-helix domain-containing protein [Mangrovitalea sediminis]
MKRILHAALAMTIALLVGIAAPSYASSGASNKVTAQTHITKPLNINRASAAELSSMLKGIGPSKASAIVAYRKTHGPFHSIDELVKVKGIGSSTISKNRSRISIQ